LDVRLDFGSIAPTGFTGPDLIALMLPIFWIFQQAKPLLSVEQ